eukprot:5465087-Amphidinium_carterae.1
MRVVGLVWFASTSTFEHMHNTAPSRVYCSSFRNRSKSEFRTSNAEVFDASNAAGEDVLRHQGWVWLT